MKIEHITQLSERLYSYCKDHIQTHQLIKHSNIDTTLYPHECTLENTIMISKLAPFGEGNPEPLLYLPQVHVLKKEKV